MRRRYLLLLIGLLTLASGCATTRSHPGTAVPADLSELDRWDASGRLGIASRDGGGSGAFEWQQRPFADLWTVEDYGGWGEVGVVFFGPGGLFDSVMEEIHAAAS